MTSVTGAVSVRCYRCVDQARQLALDHDGPGAGRGHGLHRRQRHDQGVERVRRLCGECGQRVAGERDLLVLSGAEPDYRWHQLAGDMVDLARRLGVVGWASLGAIPAAVPHTRQVPVLATASAPGLLPEGIKQGPDGVLRVPAAALSVMEVEMAGGRHPGGLHLVVGLLADADHVQGVGRLRRRDDGRRPRRSPSREANGGCTGISCCSSNASRRLLGSMSPL